MHAPLFFMAIPTGVRFTFIVRGAKFIVRTWLGAVNENIAAAPAGLPGRRRKIGT